MEIKLAGRTYDTGLWTRSRARDARAEIAHVMGGLGSTTSAIDKGERLLDLAFVLVPGFAADREFIESNATDREIADALRAIIRETSLVPIIAEIVKDLETSILDAIQQIAAGTDVGSNA